MILNTIWERYFLREIAKGFFLFIGGFYFLYILIDYSSHAKVFSETNISFGEIIVFYLCLFVKRVDLIIPFGLLLATSRTLCSLNLNNELVALLANGIPIKTLTRPFIAVGLLFVMLMYANQEYILPYSQIEYRLLEDTYLKQGQKKRHQQTQAFYDLQLPDGSTLLYQNFDSAADRFFDVFWVVNADEIFRIKYLGITPEGPEGHLVDHIKRNEAGQLILAASQQHLELPDIQINDDILSQVITGPKDQSLSRLWRQIPADKTSLTEHEATVLTYFHYKLAIPWLCLLVILGPAPHCLRFSRNLRIFLINALSILGLLTFYLLMDTTLILGQHQVVPPVIAAWGPFCIFSVAIGWRFAKMR